MSDLPEIEFASKIGDAKKECPLFNTGIKLLNDLVDSGLGAVECASVLINTYSLMVQSAHPEVRGELTLVLEKASFSMRHAKWDEIDRLNAEEREKTASESKI